MTLTDRIKMALTTSPSSTTETPNGGPPAALPPGGGAAALLEKHKQLGSGRGGDRRSASFKNKTLGKMDAPSSAPAIPLYSPETGEHVQRALFGTMAVLSRRDAWSLEDNEAKMLGPLTSSCLNQFTPGGEKWVALSVLAVSMLSVFTAKAQAVQAEIKAEKILAAVKPRVSVPASPSPQPVAPAKTGVAGDLNLPPFIADAKPS